jgi:hypothetical protein
MKTIKASQLGFILGITKKEASHKIIVALEREKGNENYDLLPEAKKYSKDPEIEIDVMSRHLGVDLEFCLNDIKKSFIKNSSTGRWIIDYPMEKFKPNKTTGAFPRTISIPNTLRSLLTPDQCSFIVQKWNSTYESLVNDHGVTFK